MHAFNSHFNMSIGYTSNAHERMNTNDCYMHYRYEYEYVTNYDFDELIFPREFDVKQIPLMYSNKTKCSALELTHKNYDIYEYSTRLFKKFNSNKPSCLLFPHVLLVRINENFLIKIDF